MIFSLALLVIVALALWIYASPRTYAYRYLFPGIAAALVFVVFPMLYTIGIGFTNYSSKNLLEFDRARQYLLDETTIGEGTRLATTVHPVDGGFRLRLEDADAEKAWLTGPVALALVKRSVPVDAVLAVDGVAASQEVVVAP